VRAIAEPAAVGERFNVAEGVLEAIVCIPELQLTHAGRIDQDAATL
jgi:hypothetical protein